MSRRELLGWGAVAGSSLFLGDRLRRELFPPVVSVAELREHGENHVNEKVIVRAYAAGMSGGSDTWTQGTLLDVQTGTLKQTTQTDAGAILKLYETPEQAIRGANPNDDIYTNTPLYATEDLYAPRNPFSGLQFDYDATPFLDVNGTVSAVNLYQLTGRLDDEPVQLNNGDIIHLHTFRIEGAQLLEHIQ